jgi:hypothetical protein
VSVTTIGNELTVAGLMLQLSAPNVEGQFNVTISLRPS